MKRNTKHTVKVYLKHLKKYRLSVFLAVFGLILGAASNVAVPWYLKKIFDLFDAPGSREMVASAMVGVLIVVIIIQAIHWAAWRVATFASAYFQAKVMEDLSNFCFAYLHKHSFGYFNNNFVGSMVRKVNKFVRSFESLADRISFNLIPLVVNLVLIIIVLLYRNPFVGIAILVWVFIYVLINYLFSVYKLKYDIKRSEAETASTRVLADTITNQSNVKLFNGYQREKKNFADANGEVRRLQRFTWDLDNSFEAIQSFLMIGLEIGIYYYAIIMWRKGIFTVGDFVLLQSYVLIICMKVWDFGRIIRHFYRDTADAEEMSEILLTPHEVQDVKNAKKLKVPKGHIEYKDVEFYYHKTRKILDKINIKINPNEKIAFVGPSGAGKTTLVKVLLRMHDIASGKVLIDDQDISRVTQESLWESVSMVPQDPMLFHRTLMENIRYGKPNSTKKEVIEAAKLAHCHEFISEFPDGYDTYVGERGVKLSGGERQRVAIARAILRNAPILVLDEATSSLDSGSELMIQDALAKLMKGKTVIVIAHRLSTIMKMDRILIVDDRKIVEEGSHKELLNKKVGLYKKLWNLQAGGFLK